MERLAATISQYVDPNKLQQSIPEYLWFVIATLGISAVIYILHRLVNYLISTIGELRESNAENRISIAVLKEMMESVKSMLQDHEKDIKLLQKRRQ